MLAVVSLQSEELPPLTLFQRLCWLFENCEWGPEELEQAGLTRDQLARLGASLLVMDLLAEQFRLRDGVTSP
jgi:hypothetical protein